MDERFRVVLTDPRYKTLRKSDRKVRVDGRFKQMFTDKRFRTESDVDPRSGVSAEQPHTDNSSLKSYYDTCESDAPLPGKERFDVRGDDAAGDLLSSSSDESSDEEEGEVEHNWAELDRGAPRSDDISSRLAVCHVDWDRISARDLFVLLHSFKPGGASVLSVKVYASEFGKQRMAEEAIRGPAEIVAAPVRDDTGIEHEEGDASEEEYLQEKLRQYQLNRLKYYYAVVECDSPATANHLYEQLDNFEFESSASSLDLRFIPDGETFDAEPVQVCTSLPDFATYKSPIFITSALQQSSVRMTWDQTDPSRAEKIETAFASRDEKALDDLQAFLASEESEPGSEAEQELTFPSVGEQSSIQAKLSKYKELLKTVEKENEKEDADIEITFDNDDEADEREEGDEGSGTSVDSNDESDESEEKTGSIFDENEVSTSRVKNKEAARKEDGLDLLVMEKGKSHFDFSAFVDDASKSKKRKIPAPLQDDFEFNEGDARFQRIYSAPEYNIDPSNPHFKKTPGMMSLIQKKAETVTQAKGEKRKMGSGVGSLVAAVKANTKTFMQRRRHQS